MVFDTGVIIPMPALAWGVLFWKPTVKMILAIQPIQGMLPIKIARQRALPACAGQYASALILVSITVLTGCQSKLPQNQLLASTKLSRQAEATQVKQKAESHQTSGISATDKTPTDIVPDAKSIAAASGEVANRAGPSTVTPSDPGSLRTPVSQEQAMAEVLSELQAIEAIDPAVREQLMADLHKAKPEQWSLIVGQFQAALAFRQQLANREAQQDGKNASENTLADTSVVVTTDQEPRESGELFPVSQKPKVSKQLANPSYSHSDTTVQLVSAKNENSIVGTDELKVGQRREAEIIQQSTSPDETSNASLNRIQSALHQLNSSNIVNHNEIEHTTELDRAIAEIEQSATDEPSNIDDIHEQMRLRLLYLLADRQEEAFRPIPGATPAQQDYWSKQLFAMTTYFDNDTQPDIKHRAAAALTHLDEARGTLSELATLLVRNLSFVSSVEGFGDYQLQQKSEFKPGEQVTLYAEVENFRSESTEQGYRTTLGTSYQVVDDNGHRVDGGQFPEVVDFCKNHRRDFHMQYGIALPTRIYAGSYELQMIVTDNQTGKIGQATLPFEIVD